MAKKKQQIKKPIYQQRPEEYAHYRATFEVTVCASNWGSAWDMAERKYPDARLKQVEEL